MVHFSSEVGKEDTVDMPCAYAARVDHYKTTASGVELRREEGGKEEGVKGQSKKVEWREEKQQMIDTCFGFLRIVYHQNNARGKEFWATHGFLICRDEPMDGYRSYLVRLHVAATVHRR